MSVPHKDILIKFAINGSIFAAIGFLEADEEALEGRSALERCARRYPVLKDKAQYAHIWGLKEELPEELHGRWLVAQIEHDPIYFIFMKGMGCMDGEWQGLAFHGSVPWGKDVLILVHFVPLDRFFTEDEIVEMDRLLRDQA